VSLNSNAALRESAEEGADEGERVEEVGVRGDRTRAVGGSEGSWEGVGEVREGVGERDSVERVASGGMVGGNRSAKGCAVGVEEGLGVMGCGVGGCSWACAGVRGDERGEEEREREGAGEVASGGEAGSGAGILNAAANFEKSNLKKIKKKKIKIKKWGGREDKDERRGKGEKEEDTWPAPSDPSPYR
jgi:hypothetical protein